MYSLRILPFIVAALCTSTSAAAIKRASCVYTCGSVCYWQSDITAAVNKGYTELKAGKTLGSDKYPHVYNDYEGFDFPTSSPYYEFPILSSFSVYSGGSPGADRVIFDKSGHFDSVLTHNGASSNNGFVECDSN